MMQSLSMQGFLHEEGSFGIFVLVTIILGGGAAALAGRAIAKTWRPWWHVVAYMLILGGVVRFIHFALFGGALRAIALHYYVVDTAICLAFGFAGIPSRARHPNGHPISLDQRTARPVPLAPKAALT